MKKAMRCALVVRGAGDHALRKLNRQPYFVTVLVTRKLYPISLILNKDYPTVDYTCLLRLI